MVVARPAAAQQQQQQRRPNILVITSIFSWHRQQTNLCRWTRPPAKEPPRFAGGLMQLHGECVRNTGGADAKHQ